MNQQTKQRPTASDQKACSKCGSILTRADFYADKRAADGLQSQCKECHKRQSKHASLRYYHRNRPACIERNRQWKAANPERLYEYERERAAVQSSRVRRIRKLLDHFEGREAYLNYIAHAIDARPDVQGLSWLCSRIDTLIAERGYGEV